MIKFKEIIDNKIFFVYNLKVRTLRKCLQAHYEFYFKDGIKTMKPFMKIGSFLLAVMMLFTALVAAGCTPISINKEWSYKSGDTELSIGVYIYSLQTAYSQAQSFAKNDASYDEASDAWLDREITDEDGNTEVASKWIKEQAEKMCKSYLVIEQQLKENNVDVDKNAIASADETAETYWNVGQYADYGYIMPMSKDLEPYGVSLDSFKYCLEINSVKYSALFDAVYGKGGSKEVSDSDLTTYFTDNYVDYSYFTVNLYESSSDASGASTNVALSEEDAKKLTDELDGYAKEINDGKSYEDITSKYMSANEVTTDPSTSKVEALENSSLGDDIKTAIKDLDTNKATTLKVGEGNSAIYYLIYKRDVKKDVDSYINDKTNRSSVLGSMKSQEYADYLEGLEGSVEFEANTSVLNQYDSKMFFVKPEPTTVASTTGAVS